MPVTIAGVAYLAQAVLGLAAAGLAFLAYTRVSANADAVVAQGEQTTETAEMVDFVTGMVFGMMAYSLVTTLVVAPLAFGVLRGSKVGRIIAWAGSGLTLLAGCCAYPLLLINATGNNTTSCGGGGCEQTAYREIIGVPVMGGLSALTIVQWLLIVAAGIMIALPPSHRWFKAVAAGTSH